MNIQKRTLSLVFGFFCCVLLSVFDNSVISYVSASGVILVVLICANERSSFHMMACVGYSVFIATPALLHKFFNNTEFDLLYITSFFMLMLLIGTNSTEFNDSASKGRRCRGSYFWGLLVAAILIYIDEQLFVVFVPFLMMLMIRAFEIKKTLYNFYLYFLFIICYFVYLFYAWDGFGRTVVAGILICATFYFFYASHVRINKYLVFIVLSILPLALKERRNFNISNLDVSNVLMDSAFGPYVLAADFAKGAISYDIGGLFDQWLFTLFVFIPRTIWTSKPYGFGFEYTVRNLEWYLIDAGHSIAATFVGEHLYFMGYWGLISAGVMVFAISFLVNFINKLKFLDGAGLAIVSANVMALIWGGMSSFSPRVEFSLIIFFFSYFFYFKFLNKWIFTSDK